MSWKYFFDRDTSFHEYLDIPLSERTKNAYDSKPVVEVAHGEHLLEAVGQLFKLDFDDIDARDTIALILDRGEIPDVLGTAKYSLMFDYEHVEVDSMAKELLPAYYESGELSEYSWIMNSESQEKEPYLMINGAKYYFGIAEIEEEGLINKISLEKLKNAVQYHFQDRDELCTSISCPCSPEKTRVWLCENCLWLIRDYRGTGVVCQCTRNKLKKMNIYCNGCKINEIEIKKDPINNKEIDVHEQQTPTSSSDKNRDGNQNHNRKEGNRTPGQSTQRNLKSTFDNPSGSGSTIDLLKRNEDIIELSLAAAGEQLHAGAVNTRRRSHDVHNQRSPSKPKTFVLEGLAPKKQPADTVNTRRQSHDVHNQRSPPKPKTSILERLTAKKQPAENRGLNIENNRQEIINAAVSSIASSSTGKEKDTQSIDGNNDHKTKEKEDTGKGKNLTENRGDINPAASNIAPLPTGAERDTKCIDNIENGPTEKSADGGKKKEDKKKEEEDKKEKEK
ncbi:hypothetical protein FO519_009899, partial [Halicephalobus sp. NKZ332]